MGCHHLWLLILNNTWFHKLFCSLSNTFWENNLRFEKTLLVNLVFTLTINNHNKLNISDQPKIANISNTEIPNYPALVFQDNKLHTSSFSKSEYSVAVNLATSLYFDWLWYGGHCMIDLCKVRISLYCRMIIQRCNGRKLDNHGFRIACMFLLFSRSNLT